MRVLVVAILASLAAVAAADPRPAAGRDTSDCARARKAGKTCELTLEAEQVGGSKPDPGGSDVRVRRFDPSGSLIRVRRDFIDAIIQAADDL
jgi:hypothetical protein